MTADTEKLNHAHEAGEIFTRKNVDHAHALGCEYGISHGLVIAIALPKVLKWFLPACEAQPTGSLGTIDR